MSYRRGFPRDGFRHDRAARDLMESHPWRALAYADLPAPDSPHARFDLVLATYDSGPAVRLTYWYFRTPAARDAFVRRHPRTESLADT